MGGITPTEFVSFEQNILLNDNDKSIRDALRAIYSRGNHAINVVNATANTTLDARYSYVLCDTTAGAFTITLPPANYWGPSKSPVIIFQYIAGAANVTIAAAAGGDTINGAANIIFAAGRQTALTDSVSKWYSN